MNPSSAAVTVAARASIRLGGVAILALLSATAAGACVPQPAAPPTLTSAEVPLTPPPPPKRVQVQYLTPGSGETALDPLDPTLLDARRQLERCSERAGTGGKVDVRITRVGDGLQLSIEPGASLDPTARHCVLEALSRIHLEDTGGRSGGPAIPPTGFTSIVSVHW